jgi:uncharacterized alpha-E superfamily protein
MLGHPDNPSAVAHCLRQMRDALASLETQRDVGPANRLFDELTRLEQTGCNVNPENILAPDSLDVLGDLRRQVDGLHSRIEDTYFSHQHAYSLDGQATLAFR